MMERMNVPAISISFERCGSETPEESFNAQPQGQCDAERLPRKVAGPFLTLVMAEIGFDRVDELL